MAERGSKTVLVTGGSRGLGLALSRELTRRGWNVVIDARGEAELEAAVAGFPSGARVRAVRGDVTDPEHRSEMVRAAEGFGGIDAIVNNAGILGPSPMPPLVDYPILELETVLRTNLIAPLALIQEARHALSHGARILNVTSDAAMQPYPGWGGYGAGKAALEQLSAVLAVENPDLVVYWVDPGDMRTRMHQEAFPGEDISDRPLPEESVPGFVALIEGGYQGGRYLARDLRPSAAPAWESR